MALILMDGFEASPVIRNSMSGAATMTTVSPGRDGIGKAMSINSALNVPTNNPATLFVGAGIKFAVGGFGSTTVPIIIFQGDGASVSHLTIGTNALGNMLLRFGNAAGTIIATSTQNISAGVWYYIEAKVVISDTVGICVVKLNGVTWINFSGDTKNAGTLSSVSNIQLGWSTSVTAWDDLILMDDTGAAPYNDFIGERVIRPMRPNGVGAVTGLTPNSAVANWTTVDEDPWSATADYNSATATATDTYAFSDVSGLTSVDAVQVAMYALKMDSGSRNIRAVQRTSGGTQVESVDFPLSTTIAPYQGAIRLTDPSGATWTQSLVNSAEYGVKIT